MGNRPAQPLFRQNSLAALSPQVQFVAQARIPTQYSTFNMKVFQEQGSGVETRGHGDGVTLPSMP